MGDVPANLLGRHLLFKLGLMVAVLAFVAVFSAKADIVETVSYIALTNQGDCAGGSPGCVTTFRSMSRHPDETQADQVIESSVNSYATYRFPVFSGDDTSIAYEAPIDESHHLLALPNLWRLRHPLPRHCVGSGPHLVVYSACPGLAGQRMPGHPAG